MTDIDQLTLKLLDGLISDEEMAALAERLATDPHARAEHVALCEVEGALQAEREDFDVSGGVAEAVRGRPPAEYRSQAQKGTARDAAQLTLKLVDGTITDREERKLDRLLADHPRARAVHVALCEQEALLWSQRADLDVTCDVMASIRRSEAHRSQATRPPEVRNGKSTTRVRRGHSATRGRRARHRRAVILPVALAAAFVLSVGAVALLVRSRRSPGSGRTTTGVALAPYVLDARLARADAGVLVDRGGRRAPAAAGQDLKPEDLIAVPARAAATIVYADGTRLDLAPQTLLAVQPDRAAPGKQLALRSGALTAQVSRQPPGRSMVIATPTSSATVVGTRFVLTASATTTRLDVLEGTVRLARRSGEAAIDVAAGHTASVAPGSPLVAAPIPRRVRPGLLALYRFRHRPGGIVADVSRVGTGLDLRIKEPNNVLWLPSGGLVLLRPTHLSSRGPATKIIRACRRTGELTVEAWIKPARTDLSGPARIVALSQDSNKTNFMLAQALPGGPASPQGAGYTVRLLTSETDMTGNLTRDLPRIPVELRRTHLVCTRSADGQLRMFIDGQLRGSGAAGGDFSPWNEDYPLSLGNEPEVDRHWLGTLHLVAIYNRALSPDQVLRNFRAGVQPVP